MLKLFVSVLQSSLDIVLVAAVLFAYLEVMSFRQLLPVVKRGMLLGLAASVGLAYGVETFLQREPVEGVFSLLAVLSASVLVVSIIWSRKKAASISSSSDGQIINPIVQWLMVLAMMTLVVPLGFDVALIFTKLFTGTAGLVSTELAVGLSVGLSALAISALLGVILRRVVSQTGGNWLSAATAVILTILLLKETTNTVQVALVRGIIPLNDWLFRGVVFMVNNYFAFHYAFLATIGVLVLLAIREGHRHRDNTEDLNPAQRRKLKAGYRHMRTLTVIAVSALVMVILTEGTSAVYANRPLQLSPATPVTDQNGVVSIPTSFLNDGRMHRFSYQTTDGTSIRFIAIHKGSGVFGVGMDACEFCGVAGYRQEGENVVCNRCGAAINVMTIGFPGGCNPIPLASQKDGDSLLISAEALEAVKGVFTQ